MLQTSREARWRHWGAIAIAMGTVAWATFAIIGEKLVRNFVKLRILRSGTDPANSTTMVDNAAKGVPFLTLNGETWGWVTKVLKSRAEGDSQAYVFFTDDRKTYVSERRYFEAFHVVDVFLHPYAGVRKKLEKHDVLLVPRTASRFNLWWSAPSFLEIWSLLPDTETPGRALHNNRWKTMAKLAELAQLDSRCLRNPSVTGHVEASNPEASSPERLWLVPSFATHFLLRLLIKLGFAPKGCGCVATERQRHACKDALESLLRVAKGKECAIIVAPGATWHPPRKPFAEAAIQLDCSTSALNLWAILTAFPGWAAPRMYLKSFDFAHNGKGSVISLSYCRLEKKLD